ncbi:MAG: hypothetical protein ABI206_11755 [Antricoccus sp.]
MITPGLAAELDLLTQALDLPDTDVADTIMRLAADAHTAVISYLGLSVAITTAQSQFDFTVLEEPTTADDIRTSLLVPLSTDPDGLRTGPASIALILYAATPGAFIDLAADLSWITGQTMAEFPLDTHLTLPPSHSDRTPIATMSTINQALGVLIGRGSIPEQAERDLHARAVSAGIEPLGAATLILASLRPPEPKPA